MPFGLFSLYILCDTLLQWHIINVIFVEDDNHFYFYSLGDSCCQNVRLLCRVMGKHASNWRRHVITLTFDLWRHRAWRWCGSSYSIHTPSLKFVGLPVPKIWHIFRLSVNRPFNLWSDLSTSKWGHGSPVSWASLLPIFSLLCPSVLDSGPGTRQTNGQTDRQLLSMHYAPALWGRGIISWNERIWYTWWRPLGIRT